MRRTVVMNQRGGCGKTTTAIALARYLADIGQRTLLVDADPQGTIDSMLRLSPRYYLYNFLMDRIALEDCVVKNAVPHLDVLCGARNTAAAETHFQGHLVRERIFEDSFADQDSIYDAVVLDVAPSVSLMQTCATVYARNVLIPVNMDTISVAGAGACLQFCQTLGRAMRSNINVAALLPTIVDARVSLTKAALSLIDGLSERYSIPVLQSIRIDATISKAVRAKQFLADYDPRSRAWEDYKSAFEKLMQLPLIEGVSHVSQSISEAV